MCVKSYRNKVKHAGKGSGYICKPYISIYITGVTQVSVPLSPTFAILHMILVLISTSCNILCLFCWCLLCVQMCVNI